MMETMAGLWAGICLCFVAIAWVMRKEIDDD